VASLADLECSELPLAAACREAVTELPRAAAGDRQDEDLPTWHELALEPRVKVQKVMSRRLDKKHFRSLFQSLGTDGQARLLSCGGPLAAGWQLASPAVQTERMDDADYRLTARTTLGQDVAAADRRTCGNRRVTGANAGTVCGASLCAQARHVFRCSIGGGLKSRSVALENVWESIHKECGYQVDRQVHVPSLDRWRWSCSASGCDVRGVAWTPQVAPCTACGAPVTSRREEAVLDLEVRSAEVPRRFLDVTVRYGVPGDPARLARAAQHAGATNAEAENEKADRYPRSRCPYPVLGLALETFGRHGDAAMRYLRELARDRAANLADGGAEAAGALVFRWGCALSVALHRANAANLRRALGAHGIANAAGQLLAYELAG